jgi:carboxyl-terminal processing protease
MSNNSFRPFIYFPILFAIVLVGGIYVGVNLNAEAGHNLFKPVVKPQHHKLTEILNYIEQEYVDTVSMDSLTEETITKLLQSLDPHSSYIPAKELQAMNEPLEGKFEGIGVEFNIIDDTIVVIAPISGGPSQKLGIQPGDRIVKIEGQTVAGTGIKSKDVMDKLRGKGGTEVNIHIFRRGAKELIEYNITRGTIPIHSIDVAFMLNAETGYIKLSRFGATTYDEYLEAFEKLEKAGMQKLILDLRGNPGGYLNAANDLADEFLPGKEMIVYTEGKARPRQNHYSTSSGGFEKNPLVILVDEGSASASEILAGAVQDNDRGTIIGRRTFGKGLVQEQVDLPDGSAIRLTIARYYTPTGRSIQKPYTHNVDEYYEEYYDRLEHGELYSKDSIQFSDSLKFTTPSGKTVYGGGGIMPDVFVPVDTARLSRYLSAVFSKGLVNQFAFNYADKNRGVLAAYKSFESFNKQFSISSTMLNEFVTYAEKNGVKKDEHGIKVSEDYIKLQIKAIIARNIWNDEGYYPVILQDDDILKRALEELK